jgi:predicted acyl esterase
MVVAGSNAPRFSVNGQNGGSVINPGAPVTAAIAVYATPQYPSYLSLPTVPLDTLLAMRI